MSADTRWWVACQVGMEALLKRDLPKHRPAYGRPGFQSFLGASPPRSPLSRHHGRFIAKVPPDALENAPELLKFAREAFDAAGEPVPAHHCVWSPWPPPESAHTLERKHAEAQVSGWKRVSALRKLLPRGAPGGKVAEWIVLSEGEVWLSVSEGALAPGGFAKLNLPPHAPSRAYLKLQEVAEAFALPFKKGQLAVEAGSAPGGAVAYLLERGLRVTGIDRGEMDARVTANPRYVHLKKSLSQTTPAAILARGPIDWWLLDINASPAKGWSQVQRLLLAAPPRLGAVLTLKLGSAEAYAEAKDVFRTAQRLAPFKNKFVALKQLSLHHTELALVISTRRA